MKVNWNFIYQDVLILCCIACAISQWNRNAFMRNYWILMSVYFLVKQLYDHSKFYKETKRIY